MLVFFYHVQKGYAAIHLASDSGHTRVFQALLSHQDININIEDFVSLVLFASTLSLFAYPDR